MHSLLLVALLSLQALAAPVESSLDAPAPAPVNITINEISIAIDDSIFDGIAYESIFVNITAHPGTYQRCLSLVPETFFAEEDNHVASLRCSAPTGKTADVADWLFVRWVQNGTIRGDLQANPDSVDRIQVLATLVQPTEEGSSPGDTAIWHELLPDISLYSSDVPDGGHGLCQDGVTTVPPIVCNIKPPFEDVTPSD